MKKRRRGKRRGRGRGTCGTIQDSGAGAPTGGTAPPVLLSISPEGVRVPDRPTASGEAARLRSELERHARDVEEFVRARQFDAIVTRVLSNIERADAPPLRIRRGE